MIPRWLRTVFWANLVAQSGIIVTGAIVRVTGSGLGCPDWPNCANGSITPTSYQAEAAWHKYIEFGNRTLTFLLVILAIAAFAGSLARVMRRRGTTFTGPKTRTLLLLSAIPLVGTFAQAVLGGITVLTGLNPFIVAGHFLVSIVIVAGCVNLVVRSAETGLPPRPLVPKPVLWLGRVLVLVSAAVITMGTIVTGSGPHSGDADTPNRMGFDLRTVAWLHADMVLLFIGLLIGLIVAIHLVQSPARTRTLAWVLFAITVIQGLIGYTQYFTGVPWLLVAFHVVGAAVLWVVVVFLLLSMQDRGHVVASGQERIRSNYEK